MKKNAKEKIYNSMLVLLETCPYEQLTISDICKEAHISRQAFYLHYKSKDEVIKETFINILEKIYLQKVNDIKYFYSYEFLEELINIYDTHSQLFISLERWYVLDYLSKDTKNILEKVTKENQTNDFKKKYNNYYLSSKLTPIHYICMEWIHHGKIETKEEIKEIIIKFVINK